MFYCSFTKNNINTCINLKNSLWKWTPNKNYTESKKYFSSSVKYAFLANAMEKGYYFYSLIHLGEIAVLEKEFNLALQYFKKVRKVTGRKHEANQLAKEKIKQIENE